MSSPASRPDRPEGAAETRRRDDAAEGHAARSASSEGSDVASSARAARDGLPSAMTSTTGQEATGVEARDASPDAADAPEAPDAPDAPDAPSPRPARPPQRPPSELRPPLAAPARDSRVAPPRASRGVAEVIAWRAKISQAARDVQSAVEDASGLRVDDSAADLERALEEEKKMVQDLPRAAGAALSDARRVAGTVAGATRDALRGAATVSSRRDVRNASAETDDRSAEKEPRRRNEKEKEKENASTTSSGVDAESDDAARLRRKAARRAALARFNADVVSSVSSAFRASSERASGVVEGVASTAARTERAGRSAAEVAAAAAAAAARRVGAFSAAGKALLEETASKRPAPEPRDLRTREPARDTKQTRPNSSPSPGEEDAERERRRREEEKLARVAEREAARRATLETLRARESSSRREKAALAARALAEREARREAERTAREAEKRAARDAREAEKRAEVLAKEAARLASMTPERRARRERARERETERDESARAARAAREAERARLAAKAEAERRAKDDARSKRFLSADFFDAKTAATRDAKKQAKPSPEKDARTPSSAFAFARRREVSATPPKGTSSTTRRDSALIKKSSDVADALGGLLVFAGAVAGAGVARVVSARAETKNEGAEKKAETFTSRASRRFAAAKKIAERAGVDVHAETRFFDGFSASVTLARVEKDDSSSFAAVASETSLCRRVGAPARVGPPLRLDAAWRAARRRLDARRGNETTTTTATATTTTTTTTSETRAEDASEPASPASAAAAALSPVEEAVRAAEAAAAATPAVAPYRAYTAGENASANKNGFAGAATPAERRDAAATGVALVTPDATPSSTPLSRTPAGTPSRKNSGSGPKALDFSAVGKAADLAVLAALTPRGTPRGTPAGTPDRTRSAGAVEESSAPRVFTLEEYARAATKLEGKKEALLRSLARLEELDAEKGDDHESAQDVESARVAEATRLSPRRDATRARRDSVDALAARRLVSNGLGALEGDPSRVPDDADGRTRATAVDGANGGEGEGDGTDDGTVSGSDDDDSDADADPYVTSARRAVARLHRECVSLETRLREREDATLAERARLSRRERDVKLAYARKAVRHLSSSLRRRALLAWVLYLDDAVKTRRLLRRAATKMRLRRASAAFESWVEYARLRRASRAERRLRELQRRAEEAEAAEMAARRAKAAAAAKAAETASLVADAEAREARARAEVEAMRSRSIKPHAKSGSDSDAE